MRKTLTILLITLIGACVTVSGQSYDRRAVADSLRRILPGLRTPADSLEVYNNLIDLTPSALKTAMGDTVYHLAVRARDEGSALEILRNTANASMSSDSILNVVYSRALSWPESDNRQETITFINIKKHQHASRSLKSDEYQQYILRLVRQFNEFEASNDNYKRIEVLFGLIYLMDGAGLSPRVIEPYVDSLEVAINRLPHSVFSLRNNFYIVEADIFRDIDHKRTFEADRKTLEIIQGLKAYYEARGRRFRSYSVPEYNLYNRMLDMPEYLGAHEGDSIYRHILELTELDPRVKEHYLKSHQSDLSYAFYKHDYARARNILLSYSKLGTRQLEELLLALDSLGDYKRYAQFAPAYIVGLEGNIVRNNKDEYNQLQLAMSLYDHRNHLAEDGSAKSEEIKNLEHKILGVSALIFVILVAVTVYLYILYRRNREMTRRLSKINRRLATESHSLRKSRQQLIEARNIALKSNNLQADFIKNMSKEVSRPLNEIVEYSHMISDTAIDIGGRHLTRFANRLELNTELLSTVVGDVLRLADMDASQSLPVQKEVINLSELTDATVAAVRYKLKEGVELSVDHSQGRVDVYSDTQRVQQILNILLSNAMKFTRKGSITLAYRELPDGGGVEISVTDTGIGIHPENKEKIFQRFVKLDSESQGAGLGLSIGRLLAEGLGGKLELDVKHTSSGARFVLILPKE